jgi:hypothetical protein
MVSLRAGGQGDPGWSHRLWLSGTWLEAEGKGPDYRRHIPLEAWAGLLHVDHQPGAVVPRGQSGDVLVFL